MISLKSELIMEQAEVYKQRKQKTIQCPGLSGGIHPSDLEGLRLRHREGPAVFETVIIGDEIQCR